MKLSMLSLFVRCLKIQFDIESLEFFEVLPFAASILCYMCLW